MYEHRTTYLDGVSVPAKAFSRKSPGDVQVMSYMGISVVAAGKLKPIDVSQNFYNGIFLGILTRRMYPIRMKDVVNGFGFSGGRYRYTFSDMSW